MTDSMRSSPEGARDQVMKASCDTDVVVVGAGPTGLTTAILLGQRGWNVIVVEQRPEAYPLPRAVHFDHEVARIFQAAGVAAAAVAASEAVTNYEWRNAAGEILLRFEWSPDGPSGWPVANMFHQPGLERLLEERCQYLPSVTVLRGYQVTGLSVAASSVTARLQSCRIDAPGVPVSAPGDARPGSVTARYLVGADGANSLIRSHLGEPAVDLGFFHDWLVVDLLPHEEREWQPVNLQICDPSRPLSAVSGGPGRRRFEFMRLPHETPQELMATGTIWRLLAPWHLHPDNATIERAAVYTFRACWASAWRRGPVLLAGDAAHLMPPFAGQGMCSGIRDAANLAWKLDLVLRRRAPAALLNTYGSERAPQVRDLVELSIALGDIICVTDPGVAARRDAVMKAERSLHTTGAPAPQLRSGVVRTPPDTLAGTLSVQAPVRSPTQAGLLDDITGGGFVLLTLGDPVTSLEPGRRAAFDGIGGRICHITSPGSQPAEPAQSGALVVTDSTGAFTAWMRAAGVEAVLVRPDFYVFGSAVRASGASALVRDLLVQLRARHRNYATAPALPER